MLYSSFPFSHLYLYLFVRCFSLRVYIIMWCKKSAQVKCLSSLSHSFRLFFFFLKPRLAALLDGLRARSITEGRHSVGSKHLTQPFQESDRLQHHQERKRERGDVWRDGQKRGRSKDKHTCRGE